MTSLTLDLVAIGSSSSVDIRRSAFVAANFIDLQPHQDLDPIASDLGRNEAMVAATRRTAAAVSLGEALYPPSAITLIVCILTAMHFAAALLPLPVVVDALSTLSFVPPRLSFLFAPDAAMGAFASATAAGVDEHDIIKLRSGVGQAWWTLVTYTLLHGSWMHLATNCLALAVFGSPVARRFGTSGFLAFFCGRGDRRGARIFPLSSIRHSASHRRVGGGFGGGGGECANRFRSRRLIRRIASRANASSGRRPDKSADAVRYAYQPRGCWFSRMLV